MRSPSFSEQIYDKINNESRQEDIWGASWNPVSQDIFYESMVNLRPRQNRAMQIIDPTVREQVKQIIYRLLGGV
jgi:hypothetical protein